MCRVPSYGCAGEVSGKTLIPVSTALTDGSMESIHEFLVCQFLANQVIGVLSDLLRVLSIIELLEGDIDVRKVL